MHIQGAPEPSPPPARRWPYLLLIIAGALLVLLSCTGLRSNASQESNAPIVIDAPIGSCQIAPGGQFVATHSGSQFFDLKTGNALPSPNFPPKLKATRWSFWLSDRLYYYYTEGEEQPGEPFVVRKPINGWLFDPVSGVITDVLDLPPSEQLAWIEQAVAQERRYQWQKRENPISPDGRYIFYNHGSAARITDQSGKELNSVTTALQPCDFGWRPDSSGYYFVEQRGIMAGELGPLRVLLIKTRPTPPQWFWAVTATSGLLIIITIWIRSQR